MKADNFFTELKRRNVYKVAVAYIVAGWALSQGIAQVLPVFDVPNWVIRFVVLLIIIGLGRAFDQGPPRKSSKKDFSGKWRISGDVL